MLLSAGFCLPLSSDSWDVFTGKQAIHRREARELLPVNNVSVEYGTELRIPLLDNPENTYKMLFLIKDLGWLGIQKQKEIDGLAHSPELVNVWNNLIQSFNGLLEQYHLPSITDMWTFSDFERLRGILSNKDTVDFQHQARKLLTQSRIEMSRLYKEDLPEIVPAQKAETNKSKEPNLSFVDRVEKAILAYEKRLTNFERRFLQPDSEEIESVSSRMRRCFGLLTLSIGSNLYFLLGDNRFITPTLLFYILTNPEAVRGALTTIRSILKSKPELSKAFFSELGNLELISLSYLLTNIICGEKTATLTWTTIFLGSMITNKLIHKFKPIESYV
jgi:DNA-dependent RNA polymerase auxiliary subunit epsilon